MSNHTNPPPKHAPAGGISRKRTFVSMNRQTIKEAKAEAQTFIKACDDALAQLDHEVHERNERWNRNAKQSPSDYSWGSKQTGTLRRKSMDLTRILATLRRYSA